MVWLPSIRHRLRVLHVRSDLVANTVTTWVPELCGAPDVPHAVQSASKSSNNASKLSLTVGNHVVSPSSSLVSVAVEDEVVCVDIGGGFESVAPELTARSQREPLKVTFRFATPLPTPLSTPNNTVTSGGSIGGSTKVVNAEWLALLWRGDLYLTVPNGIVIERSKEAFITLLEFAEEKLQCKSIVVCFSKTRTERSK